MYQHPAKARCRTPKVSSGGIRALSCYNPLRGAQDARLHAVAEEPQHYGAHLALLVFDGLSGIDDVEADLLRHGFIFVQDAAQRDVQGNAEIEAEGGAEGKAVEIAHPLAADAAGHVAGKGSVGIAV